MTAASPASAQVGAALSLATDARFRGFSISDNHPVASLDFAYDDASGAYAAATGTAMFTDEGVHPFSMKLNAGYSKRLASGITVDAGVVHSRYSHYLEMGYADRDYTEVYAGVARGNLSGRLYVSPRYFETGGATLYGEVENSIPLTRKLQLSGHAGLLVPLVERYGWISKPVFDWRIGLSQQFGRVSAHASWSGRKPQDGPGFTGGDTDHGVVVGINIAL